jgi:hypothetical protein
MQRGADADHARAKDDNIGFEVCHPALRKFNVSCARRARKLKLIIALQTRKPLGFLAKPACTARNLWQQWTSVPISKFASLRGPWFANFEIEGH